MKIVNLLHYPHARLHASHKRKYKMTNLHYNYQKTNDTITDGQSNMSANTASVSSKPKVSKHMWKKKNLYISRTTRDKKEKMSQGSCTIKGFAARFG